MNASSNTNIFPCIWFDGKAKEAFDFYVSVFPNSRITDENPIVVKALLDGTEIMGLNGGPMYKPNPALSFMWVSNDKVAIAQIWEKLAEDGRIFMQLDSYPWSASYGWIEDRYGVSWQLYYGADDWKYNKLVPTLMFGQAQQGQCQQALDFYERTFPAYKNDGLLRYSEGPMTGQIQHTQFTLNGHLLMAMDSGVPQHMTFTEGVSLVLECDDQETIDYYWNAFTKSGEEGLCGWCKDPFGISWQVVPKNIGQLLFKSHNPQKAQEALMQMRKIEITELQNA
ncbi:VOC family protein [Chitinophaga filiformis]|uniref:Glyoxalase superfamily enzyme, possibly 3-demethylubiquinone-9 3-methyltransferase n=1 Tax=Chitinophaga filiformis TaxID=104663 RepID=A0A1G7MAW1_CHIFI|nr:VOC family protein [Chitinophaga filiformis]SDF58389.1 Glyoxalase superfamily enzyme, possibly 3-demethylubiquinone-9 3-methyltransferase [Chitinophaga filiformis]